MELQVNMLQDNPVLDDFKDGNNSIRHMIEGSFFTTVRHQGFAYTIEHENKIIGYYMVQAGGIQYTDPNANDESEKEYGILKLKYIIIDERYRNQGVGSKILDLIISRANEASKQVPIRFLVLEALKEKRQWYEYLGFQYLQESENDSTVFMFMDFINQEQLDEYIRTYLD